MCWRAGQGRSACFYLKAAQARARSRCEQYSASRRCRNRARRRAGTDRASSDRPICRSCVFCGITEGIRARHTGKAVSSRARAYRVVGQGSLASSRELRCSMRPSHARYHCKRAMIGNQYFGLRPVLVPATSSVICGSHRKTRNGDTSRAASVSASAAGAAGPRCRPRRTQASAASCATCTGNAGAHCHHSSACKYSAERAE